MKHYDSLEQVFQDVARHFLPEKAGDTEALVQVRVQGEKGGTWFLYVHQGKLDVLHQPPADLEPDVTLEVTTEDFWKLLYGEMDPLAAYMRGRLRIQGELKLLMRMSFLFRLPDEGRL